MLAAIGLISHFMEFLIGGYKKKNRIRLLRMFMEIQSYENFPLPGILSEKIVRIFLKFKGIILRTEFSTNWLPNESKCKFELVQDQL